MAKTFYYDSVGLLESTLNDGAVADSDGDSKLEFTDASNMTKEDAIIDQSLSVAVAGFGQNEAIQIDLGSSKAVDFIGFYFNAAETDNLVLEVDSSATGESSARVATITDNFSANAWSFNEFTEDTERYWRIAAVSVGGLVGLTEVILGKKLQFEINPDMGIGESNEFGTDINKSVGGVEYAVLRHEPIVTISLNFSSISSTFKDNLESMQNDIQNYKKFVYSEDGTTGPFHYVRLQSPIDFKEVSVNRFSCAINLVKQLS